MTQVAPDREAERQSSAEWFDRLASCLRAEGWQVTWTDDGGMEVDYSGSSEEAFFASEDACEERIGPQPTPAPLTENEIAEFYRQDLQIAECLAAQGVEVDEPPSLELYTQDYLAMEPPWAPYDGVHDTAALAACPRPQPSDS